MDAALRAQYLNRLGIVSYVPRVETAPVYAQWEGPRDASLVFLFQSEGPILDWSTPVLQLLQKIMDAVRTPRCSIALCFAEAPFEPPAMSHQPHIVMFGQPLTRKATTGKMIETLVLGELQYNDAAKRTLWQALRGVKAVYG